MLESHFPQWAERCKSLLRREQWLYHSTGKDRGISLQYFQEDLLQRFGTQRPLLPISSRSSKRVTNERTASLLISLTASLQAVTHGNGHQPKTPPPHLPRGTPSKSKRHEGVEVARGLEKGFLRRLSAY